MPEARQGCHAEISQPPNNSVILEMSDCRTSTQEETYGSKHNDDKDQGEADYGQ